MSQGRQPAGTKRMPDITPLDSSPKEPRERPRTSIVVHESLIDKSNDNRFILTEIEELFCQHYVASGNNLRNAAQLTCIAQDTAHDLLEKPSVCHRISELEQGYREHIINPQWVISGLKTIIEDAMTAKEVLNRAGAPTGQYRKNLHIARDAYETLAKIAGMTSDAPTVNVGMQINLENLRSMSDKEFAAYLKKSGVPESEYADIIPPPHIDGQEDNVEETEDEQS
jgi:hypothetical protein